MERRSYTTDYTNTLIEIAEDSPNIKGVMPSVRAGKETVATRQFTLLSAHPYEYTSDALLFQVYADRSGIPEINYATERGRFFSKPQACLRASPLPKQYGWGIHFDENARVALIDSGSPAYRRLIQDNSIKKVKAMRSARTKHPERN